jgi:hypothetical protein
MNLILLQGRVLMNDYNNDEHVEIMQYIYERIDKENKEYELKQKQLEESGYYSFSPFFDL